MLKNDSYLSIEKGLPFDAVLAPVLPLAAPGFVLTGSDGGLEPGGFLAVVTLRPLCVVQTFLREK